MKERFKSILNNKILNNFIVVFLGDGFSSILTLINLSIMIRVLGFNSSSIVNLAISYVLVFDTIFNFQSFNSIIKFLPKYILANNTSRIKSYIYQGFILDIGTAFISFICSHLLLEFIANIFNWDGSIINLIKIYSFAILFNITGTSIGIIRVFDKFKYSSYINIFVNSLKFILYLLSFFIKVNMVYFIVVELTFNLLNMILLLIFTKNILYKQNIKFTFKKKIKWDKEFLKFNFYCNFMTTLDVPMSHLTPFLINNFIGIDYISIYKVIEKIGGIVAKIASPLVNIIYPEISIRVSEGNKKQAISLVKKIFLLICSFGIVCIILVGITHKIWIDILIVDGEKFIYNILFYLVFIIFKFSFVGIYPLFISLGYIKYNIFIIIIANSLYLLSIPIFTKMFNINGIIISQFIQVVLVLFMQIFVINWRSKIKD